MSFFLCLHLPMLMASGVPDKAKPDLILSSPMRLETIAKRYQDRFPFLNPQEYKELLLTWNSHIGQEDQILPVGTELYLHRPTSPFVAGGTYHPKLIKGVSQNKRWSLSIGSLSNIELYQQTFGTVTAEKTRVSPLGFSTRGEMSWSDTTHLEGLLRYTTATDVEVSLNTVEKTRFSSTLNLRALIASHFNLWHTPSYPMIGFGRLETQLLNLETAAQVSRVETQKISPLMGYLGWQHRLSWGPRFQQRLSLLAGLGVQEVDNPFLTTSPGYQTSYAEFLMSHYFGKSLRIDTSAEYLSLDGPSTLETINLKLETHFVF